MATPTSAGASTIVQAKAGHGLDIDGVHPVIPNAIEAAGDRSVALLPVITLRELGMLGFINAVTDKPDWTKKVFDKSIIAKWKKESVTAKRPIGQEMTEAMFQYCIKELQYRAKRHDASPQGAVQVFAGDVYKSDTAISEDTKLALQKAVRVLEDVPAQEKDWHPGSDGKVLDLVHPSLFPLVYGISKILPLGANVTTLEDCVKRCGEGETLPEGALKAPKVSRNRSWFGGGSGTQTYSKKFQWLPCEVDISSGKARITTYINNLHPTHHRELYTIIEDILSATIPLWELTLAPLQDEDYEWPRRLYYYPSYSAPEVSEEDEPEQEEGEGDDEYNARFDAWNDERNAAIADDLPDPHTFGPLRKPPSFKFLQAFPGAKKLQVIVKLANIELTPEKPEYEGGAWHVEGQMNEKICASAIYYYSSENITASSLSFRQQGSNGEFEDMAIEQNHVAWLPAVYGLDNHHHTIQTLGSVDTREGRLITFPNILQHQVQPFKLADPTKPGHRKILALFLVDPHVEVISTADVPVQRRDWWQEELMQKKGNSVAATPDGTHKLAALPLELQDLVFDGVEDFPIDMEKAKELREELMAERKTFVWENCKDFASTSISLCEH